MPWPSRLPLISTGVIAILMLAVVLFHYSSELRNLPVPNETGIANHIPPKNTPKKSQSILTSKDPSPNVASRRHSLLTSNQTLSDFLNRDGNAPRVTPDQSARLTSLSDPVEIEAVVELLMDASEGETERNEAINLLRRSQYVPLSNRLLDLVDRGNETERMRCFVTQHLGMSLEESQIDTRHRIIERLRVALRDRHPGVRRQALSNLVRIGDAEGVKQMSEGLDNHEWEFARDLIIYCLFETNQRNAITKLRVLATDSDEVVRIAAIYVLGQWKDEFSMPLFKLASLSSSYRLRQAGEMAMLTFQENPYIENP